MIREYANAMDLPAEYYTAIGEMMFRWAQLEHQMQEIIWRAMRIDNKQGRTLTVGMGSKVLCATLKTLTRQWLITAKDKQRANSIAKGAGKIAEFRNYLAHGSWEFPSGGDQKNLHLIYMKETAHRILPKAVKHTPEEIRKKAGQLRQLNKRAQDLIYDLDMRNEMS